MLKVLIFCWECICPYFRSPGFYDPVGNPAQNINYSLDIPILNRPRRLWIFFLSCHGLVWFGFKIYRLYLGVWRSLGSLLILDHLLWNGHSHFTKVRLAHNGLDDKFCCKRTGQLRRGQSEGDRIWKKTAEWNYVANTTLSSLELLKIKWKFE